MTKDSKHHKGDKRFRLDDLKAKARYVAPANYFEDLPEQIMMRIDTQAEKVMHKTIPIWRNWWVSVSALAAASIILLFVYPWYQNNDANANLLSDVSDDEIIAYLMDSDLHLDEIISDLNAEKLHWKDDLTTLDVTSDESEALLEYYTL